jgi:hypothetical protein
MRRAMITAAGAALPLVHSKRLAAKGESFNAPSGMPRSAEKDAAAAQPTTSLTFSQ